MKLDGVPNGVKRQVMSRPNKEARGRTFTWARTQKHWDLIGGQFSDPERPRPNLSSVANTLLVRGTCDRLTFMATHYYRQSVKSKDRCKCCGQVMPRIVSLNKAGKRRLATLKRRNEKRRRKLLSPLNRPLSWIVWIEDIAEDRKSPV